MARTLDSFLRHKERSESKCCKSWIVLSKQDLLGYSYMITPHLCKSDYCEICRKKNLLKRRKQLFEVLRGGRWRMITLTFDDHTKDKTEQFIEAHKMIKKFVQRLRRKYEFRYARVFEVHESGFPHVHFIVDVFIPFVFIQQCWKDVGGGWAWISEPKCTKCGKSLPCVEHSQKKYVSYKQAARYMTEEIEKKKQDVHKLGAEFWQSGVRSIMTSRNLPLKKLPTSGEWFYLRGAENLKDAMYAYEQLYHDFKYNGGVEPSIDFGKRCIMVGTGYKDKIEIDFHIGSRKDVPIF